MMKFGRIRTNDKGLSLVELIVAISIGTIVSASVTALIAFAIRSYHNESVNTALQYEVQANVNQVMDAIMSSSGTVIFQADGKTKYAGFGDFQKTASGVKFSGVVLASGTPNPTTGVFDIYMRRVTDIPGTDASVAVSTAASPLTSPSGDMRPYLLGQNAKTFNITIETDTTKSGCIVKPWTDNVSSPGEYINPILVDVELEFEKDGAGRKINKKLKDNAIMRNKVTSDIWIDGHKYVLKK